MAIQKVCEDLCSYLQSLNFHFLKTWVIECVNFYNSQNPNISFETLKSEIKQQWLLVNLRDIKVPSLPPNLVSCHKTILKGTYAVQVETMIDSSQSCYFQLQKLQNISTEDIEHTKDKSEPKVIPKRCLTFTISDGVQELQAMEYQPISKIRTNDPELLPGFKMLIIGPVECRKGMILLKDENVQICGGEVDTLTTSNSLKSILMKRLNLNEDDYPDNEPNRVVESNRPDGDSVPSSVSCTPVLSASSSRPVQSTSGFESVPSVSSFHSIQSSSRFESLPSTSSFRPVPSASSSRPFQSTSGFESIPSVSSFNSIQSSSHFESLPSTSSLRPVPSASSSRPFQSTSGFKSVSSVSSFHSIQSSSGFESLPSTSNFEPVLSVRRDNENVEALLSQNDDLFLSLPLETVSLEENLNHGKNNTTNSNTAPSNINYVSETDTKLLTRDNIFDDILSFVNKKHGLPEEDNNVPNKKKISLDPELINEDSLFSNHESVAQSSMMTPKTDVIIIPDDDLECQIQNIESNNSHWNVRSTKKPVQTTLSSFFSKRDYPVSFSLDNFHESHDPKPIEIKPVVVSDEPFVYLKEILNVDLKEPSVFKIKGIILTLTKKITVENDEYNLRATITDGSLSIEASFSSKILEDFLGFSPCEMTVMMRAKQTNSAIDQRIKEAFSKTQQKLISLNCLMEVMFYPNSRIPEILSLEEINTEHLNALRERLLKKL